MSCFNKVSIGSVGGGVTYTSSNVSKSRDLALSIWAAAATGDESYLVYPQASKEKDRTVMRDTEYPALYGVSRGKLTQRDGEVGAA